MARGVNEVQVVNLAIQRFVFQRCRLRLDGDASFFLDVHRVQHLGLHLTGLQPPTALN